MLLWNYCVIGGQSSVRRTFNLCYGLDRCSGTVFYELERPTARTPCVHGYLLCALPLRRLRWSQPCIGDTSLAARLNGSSVPRAKEGSRAGLLNYCGDSHGRAGCGGYGRRALGCTR
jgi:hypothetical protein